MHPKPVFNQDDIVVADLPGGAIRGTIIGKATEHVIDMWIVLADNGETIPNSTYPFKAFTCPGPQLTKVGRVHHMPPVWVSDNPDAEEQ